MANRIAILASVLAATFFVSACQTAAPYKVPGFAAEPPKKLFAQPDFRSAWTTTSSQAYGAPAAQVTRSPNEFSLSYYASGNVELSDIDYDIAPLIQSGETINADVPGEIDTRVKVLGTQEDETDAKVESPKPKRVKRQTEVKPESEQEVAARASGPTSLDSVFAKEPEMQVGSSDYTHAQACKSQLSKYVAFPTDQSARRELLTKWRTCVAAKSMASLAGS